jgi:hypothetical protein
VPPITPPPGGGGGGAVDTCVGDIDGSGEMYYLLAGAVILIGTGAVTAGVIRRNRRNT